MNPKFIDKLNVTVEKLIESIEPAEYCEFSKGKEHLLQNLENFLFLEKNYEENSFYFQKFFFMNY